MIKDLILNNAPIWIQNAAISVFNRRQWWMRQSGEYQSWLSLCHEATQWDSEHCVSNQAELLDAFLRYAVTYSSHYADCDPDAGLQSFPVLEKQTLINNLDCVATIRHQDGIVSYTGGTTGASMKVIYTLRDTQKRFATLDWFRSLSGWSLGKRTAWFSGKPIVRDKDLNVGICYRDDWLTNTRFFSTFHINEKNFTAYWQALVKFDPQYIVGFPSSIVEILAIARNRGLTYPHKITAIFPTAETVLPFHRELFKEVFGARTWNQYASSEGAPFIVECPSGGLHILPHTGVFEVVDQNGQPAREGELLVTAFQTHGTPLIRYRIGDRVKLAPDGESCRCGWKFPRVERIEGRTTDFVWSPERGRINLGNLSNTTKGVPGLVAFRVLQHEPDAITVEVQASDAFDDIAVKNFEMELRKRTGDRMTITIVRRDHLNRSASGKFRIVVNTLTSEQMEILPPSTLQ